MNIHLQLSYFDTFSHDDFFYGLLPCKFHKTETKTSNVDLGKSDVSVTGFLFSTTRNEYKNV